MELEIVNNEAENRFITSVDDLLSEIIYIRTDNNELLITGTHVPKELEGRGIAAAMTKFVLDYARENQLTVKPSCSYTIAYLKKHPEYNDLLDSDI